MATTKFKRIPHLSKEDIERFWAKVKIRSIHECWDWTAANREGYGVFFMDAPRYSYIATRVVYRLEYGIDPGKWMVCHRCDRPSCCNPRHLFLGDARKNMQDASIKGRLPSGEDHWTQRIPERLARGARSGASTHPEMICKGERNGNAKLTDDQIIEIRKRRSNGEKVVSLASEYGISPALVSHVAVGRAWKHLPDSIESARKHTVTEQMAQEIKTLCRQGMNHRLVALQFGISRNHVSNIACGLRWKHL